jgi:hypothetical protein
MSGCCIPQSGFLPQEKATGLNGLLRAAAMEPASQRNEEDSGIVRFANNTTNAFSPKPSSFRQFWIPFAGRIGNWFGTDSLCLEGVKSCPAVKAP